jgi:hypothetical protein
LHLGTTPVDHPAMPLDPAAAAKKLKLSAATSPAVVNATDEDREALSGVFGSPIRDGVERDHDWILLYARDRTALARSLPSAAAALASPGTLWIAYPKGSSKVQTDLTRDAGWDAVKDHDLMWLALISIDDTWSAFSLRKYKPGEARQTFR